MSATRALHFGGRVARHNQRKDSRQPQQHHAAASHPLLARRWLPPTFCYIALQHASGRALAHIMGPQPGAGVWCVQMLALVARNAVAGVSV